MTHAEIDVVPSATEMEGAGTAMVGGEVTEDEAYRSFLKEIRTVHGSHQPPHGSSTTAGE